MAVKPLFQSPPQFVDANGDPYSGAFLFFYAAGSSTKQDTYTDDTGNTACPNPITLNSSGYPAVSGTILAPWGTVGETYKIGLAAPGSADPPASFIWTADDVAPINDTTVTIDQWVSGPAPTYIGATSFSLVGDQTSTFHAGRRLKSTNSGGTIYSYIVSSTFGAVTTVTVVNDSGTLDAGMSAVFYGLLSATDPSTPLLADTYPIVSGSADKTKKVRLEVDGLTTATTRVGTVPDYDFRIGNLPAGIGPLPYAGSSIPTGWLECDGSAVSRTTYAALFTAIGTTWGAGDGSSTFNLPNCDGRLVIGDGTGTVAEAVTASSSNGFTVAANNTKWITGMTVVISNLTGFGGTISATTLYAVRISSTNVRFASTLALAQAGSPDITITGTGTATLTTTFTARTLGEQGGEEGHAMSSTELLAHTHSADVTNQQQIATGGSTFTKSGGSTGSTGGNAAMNIMSPFIVTKMIISY